jgi:N-acetyl-gamma-glutamyl-phosphate reductase
MIRVTIVGATGYTGGELLRLLLRHPHVDVRHVTSESRPGQSLVDVHPFLRGRLELTLEEFVPERLVKDTDVFFFALPHGVAVKPAVQILKAGGKVIDLSADFRLKDAAVYEAWYKVKHAAPKLLDEAVYGLPELYREQIRGSRLVANPGCYATTTILALTPLLRKKLIQPGSVVVDAKSGVSGAGRKAEPMYLFCEATENFQAYAPVKHRHVPEIEQVLADQGAGAAAGITFTPHLVPMTRGIHVTAYGTLKKKMSADDVRAVVAQAYDGERFIRLLPSGRWPQTKDVAGTNYVDLAVTVDERHRRVVVFAVLDNLVKGASGQAIQNLNLLFGFDEDEGLK